MGLYFSLHRHWKGINYKLLAGMLTFATMLLMLGGEISCNRTISSTIKKSIVEVWIPGRDEQVSLGVVVGDGTMVLTVVNYEDYNPGEVKVVSGSD